MAWERGFALVLARPEKQSLHLWHLGALYAGQSAQATMISPVTVVTEFMYSHARVAFSHARVAYSHAGTTIPSGLRTSENGS
jgi:hypothetical protein